MDPVSQGALGAIAVQAILGRKAGKHAWIVGAAGGMAPDLDILIRSSTDALLAIEMHRHFTHSLIFAPIGGAIAALPFLGFKRFRACWPWVLLAGIIGYLTHAPLDCGTSYGTLWFWPFTSERVTWDFIPIIDPIYTLVLVGFVIRSARTWAADGWTHGQRIAVIGLLATSLYLGFSGFQRYRAGAALDEIARQRGDDASKRNIIPIPLSNLAWVSIYEKNGAAQRDTIFTPWWSGAHVIEGGPVLLAHTVPDAWKEDTEAQRLVDVWTWFSQGWIHINVEQNGFRVCDVRHSMSFTTYAPIFCANFRDGQIEQSKPTAGKPAQELKDLFSGDLSARPVYK